MFLPSPAARCSGCRQRPWLEDKARSSLPREMRPHLGHALLALAVELEVRCLALVVDEHDRDAALLGRKIVPLVVDVDINVVLHRTARDKEGQLTGYQ